MNSNYRQVCSEICVAKRTLRDASLTSLHKPSFLRRIQRSRFLWITALQKGIAQYKPMAIDYCNAYRLRPVSTDDLETVTQGAALQAAGCERIYRKKASGGRWERPELHCLLDRFRKRDVLAVLKFDRLSRSLRNVLTNHGAAGRFRGGLPHSAA